MFNVLEAAICTRVAKVSELLTYIFRYRKGLTNKQTKLTFKVRTPED